MYAIRSYYELKVIQNELGLAKDDVITSYSIHYTKLYEDSSQYGGKAMGIFDHYQRRYEAAREEEYTLQEFLDLCRDDRSCYVSAAERLLMAIGEPEMVDTALDPRLSRIFSNRIIPLYPAFKDDFYGMEEAIEQIVAYLKHAAQGLEERKQILYLLGPVGGGKS